MNLWRSHAALEACQYCELQATLSQCIDWMFLHQLDLTTALRPSLLPEETLLFVQDAVGLYEGYVLACMPAACACTVLTALTQQIQDSAVPKWTGLLDFASSMLRGSQRATTKLCSHLLEGCRAS